MSEPNVRRARVFDQRGGFNRRRAVLGHEDAVGCVQAHYLVGSGRLRRCLIGLQYPFDFPAIRVWVCRCDACGFAFRRRCFHELPVFLSCNGIRRATYIAPCPGSSLGVCASVSRFPERCAPSRRQRRTCCRLSRLDRGPLLARNSSPLRQVRHHRRSEWRP